MFDEILQYSQRGYSNIQGPIPVARRLENGLDGVSYQKAETGPTPLWQQQQGIV